MNERMRCDRPICKHFRSRWEADGGSTFLCAASPGLILGGVNLVEHDMPYEANGCHSERVPVAPSVVPGKPSLDPSLSQAERSAALAEKQP